MPRRVFITVAEVSGDRHAAELIRALRARDPGISVQGVGGPRMLEAGADIIHETVGAAAMGWRGALRAIEVFKLLKRVRKLYLENPPHLHICIDSSAMNIPFAKLAHSFGIPVLYYIAPQLWASREGRIAKLRRYVDRVACILPFEEEYFRRHGVNATFVGHPLFDEIPHRRNGSPPGTPGGLPPVVGIIPGSRRGEVLANLPHLMDVAERITRSLPGTRFLMPTTSETHAVVTSLGGRSPNCEIRLDGFDDLIPQCQLCLCKSGTSTLHVAVYGVPMIVVYRVNPLIWHLAARWMVKTRKIALVNILAGNVDLVPEFVPWYGSNEPVARCAVEMLRHPRVLQDQRHKLLHLVRSLDHAGASANTAKLALAMMQSEAPTVVPTA
ncbi:MAG: lipid-A-disaccharide synthase [Tepidisphaeraceae bacterium]